MQKENVKPCEEELIQYIVGLFVVVRIVSFPAQKKSNAKYIKVGDEHQTSKQMTSLTPVPLFFPLTSQWEEKKKINRFLSK